MRVVVAVRTALGRLLSYARSRHSASLACFRLLCVGTSSVLSVTRLVRYHLPGSHVRVPAHSRFRAGVGSL